MRTPVKSDSRYTITTEYTGHESGKPRHVVRFCGDMISHHSTYSAALIAAVGHKQRRNGALVVTEVKTPGTREDFRTGQFFPTVNGIDKSPSSFSQQRALEIAEQLAEG